MTQKTDPSTQPTPSDAQTLLLPSNRTLGYAEYGHPKGHPLLYFHGYPTSRLEAYPLHDLALKHNIRLLSLDRPGYGLSTHDPTRKITDWPQDVREFAARLGLRRFAVFGVSGGGPYALACAEGLPGGMLSAVGVLAGAGRWEAGVWSRDVQLYRRGVYLAANYWPGGMRALADGLVGGLGWVLRTGVVERRIERWIEVKTRAEAGKKEREREDNGGGVTSVTLMDLPEEIETPTEVASPTAQRRERLMGLIFEAFRNGTAGTVYETQLLTQDWGLDFENIAYDKVLMWHGSKDVNSPIGSIRDMARRMPHCVLKEFEDDDHYQMGHRFDEVFGELMAEVAASSVAVEVGFSSMAMEVGVSSAVS